MRVLIIILLLIGACAGGLYYSWQAKTEAYLGYIKYMIESYEMNMPKGMEVVTEGFAIEGFPFENRVVMSHSSLVSDDGIEHLEIHSHRIAFTLESVGNYTRTKVEWLEPIKVIYGRNGNQNTYRVKQVEPMTAYLKYGSKQNNKTPTTLDTMPPPNRAGVKLPKPFVLEATCGEVKETIAFPKLPEMNTVLWVEIPTNLYNSLRIFTYMIDEALKGKGNCIK